MLSSDTSTLNSSVPPVVSSGKLTVAGRFDRDGYFCEPASKTQPLGPVHKSHSLNIHVLLYPIGLDAFSMERCILL